MCIEDIRLGRKTRAAQTRVTLGVVSVLTVGNAFDRVSLIFSNPSAASVTFSINNPAVDGEGITIATADPPVKLNIRDDGRLVTSQWFAVAAVGTPTVDVFETFLEEK